jgi:hypothetical protein
MGFAEMATLRFRKDRVYWRWPAKDLGVKKSYWAWPIGMPGEGKDSTGRELRARESDSIFTGKRGRRAI